MFCSISAAKARHSVRLKRHPYFECLEVARKFQSAIAEGHSARQHSTFRRFKIARRRAKCGSMCCCVANQHAANVEGQIHPFVQIEGEGIRLLHTSKHGCVARRQIQQRAERTVHVEPEILLRQSCASPSRSSTAPVLTVPAVPRTAIGRKPAARSAAICAARSGIRIR